MPPKFSRENKYPILFYTKPPEYQMKTSPCEANCPAGNTIQKTHSLIQNGQFEEALENLITRNPFPGITGRVCHHPCENHCNRNQYDQSLSIKALERAASDYGGEVKKPIKNTSSGKKVAIIGSGPAGLTSAYYLSLLGHEVMIFEALPYLGGIPRVAIPDYKLPKEIVDREVARILELGVKVRINTMIGKDLEFEEVVDSYDACLIAIGAWRSKKVNIPGNELAISGKDFLIRAKSERPKIGEKVLVMGSGGVAMDCACTALRLGATEVQVVCRAPKDKMKATPELIELAKREGVVIHPSQAIQRILTKEGRVTGVESLEIRSYEVDKEGRVEISTIAESLHSFPAEMVIMAIGQAPDLEFLKDVEGMRFNTKGTLDVDPFTLATGRMGVFAAGDVVTGPSSIAEAIGSGRRAAFSIDAYLRGLNLDEIRRVYVDSAGIIMVERGPKEKGEILSQHIVKFEELMNLEYFEKKDRISRPSKTFLPSERSFEEIDKGYSEVEARDEAKRCFHCGRCFGCGICVDICPGDILVMEDKQPQLAYPEECWHCGSCLIDCPASAISFHIPLPLTLATYPEKFF